MDRPDAKPLDVGTGRVCASFGFASASWLSVGMPHARHGFIELSALPPFDETWRGNPEATRRYRLAMTKSEHAFLSVTIDGAPPRLEPDLAHPMAPVWTAAGVEVRSAAPPGSPAIRQSWSIGAGTGPLRAVELRLRGRIDRPALAEITELEPPQPTGATTSFDVTRQVVHLRSTELPCELLVTVSGAAIAWQADGDGLRGVIAWPEDDDRLTFAVEVAMDGPELVLADGSAQWPAVDEPERIVGRALAYVRGCAALSTGSDERVMLSDHRILPLSWTRDAYWQALALLAADGPGDRERVADHLRWLWRRCERPDGRWMRSHHADGRRKDLAFQADQQLYPVVELADYWRLTESLPVGVAWDDEVARAWDAALERVDPALELIGSGENAADDPAVAPFIASSQIVLWYAAGRIGEVAEAGALGLDAAGFHATAARVHASFQRWIAPESGSAWPYAVDSSGRGIAYHDANDLPTALAPLWGFCARDDPGWIATMAFAFSPANPGWVAGRLPGLGSAHTPGPWSLGMLQAWIRARAIGDDIAADTALRQLEEVAFVDGMLPEAYDADGGKRIRHWFAWPGAALAALRMLERPNRLEVRLSGRADGRIGA